MLSEISRKCGLSVNTIYTVYNKTQTSGLTEFTTKRIAELCQYNVRTVDRLLQKLIDAKCCQVVGKTITEGHGRPSRIFRFNWER